MADMQLRGWLSCSYEQHSVRQVHIMLVVTFHQHATWYTQAFIHNFQ